MFGLRKFKMEKGDLMYGSDLAVNHPFTLSMSDQRYHFAGKVEQSPGCLYYHANAALIWPCSYLKFVSFASSNEKLYCELFTRYWSKGVNELVTEIKRKYF